MCCGYPGGIKCERPATKQEVMGEYAGQWACNSCWHCPRCPIIREDGKPCKERCQKEFKYQTCKFHGKKWFDESLPVAANPQGINESSTSSVNNEPVPPVEVVKHVEVVDAKEEDEQTKRIRELERQLAEAKISEAVEPQIQHKKAVVPVEDEEDDDSDDEDMMNRFGMNNNSDSEEEDDSDSDGDMPTFGDRQKKKRVDKEPCGFMG